MWYLPCDVHKYINIQCKYALVNHTWLRHILYTSCDNTECCGVTMNHKREIEQRKFAVMSAYFEATHILDTIYNITDRTMELITQKGVKFCGV